MFYCQAATFRYCAKTEINRSDWCYYYPDYVTSRNKSKSGKRAPALRKEGKGDAEKEKQRKGKRGRRVLKSRFTIARWATIATGNRVLQKRFNESRRRHRLSVATTRHPYESIILLVEIRLSLLPGKKTRISPLK